MAASRAMSGGVGFSASANKTVQIVGHHGPC